MALPNPEGGLASFEKELICSICTEVLYQPLTILNCLHTFCGSCLKEWFSHQHRKASSSRSSSRAANPYSCPTCRAEVVDVQHNATVSNLLELFLAANPARSRSQEEKDDMDKIYKPDGTRPGDKILPKVERRRERRTRREDSQAARERQMIEDARQASLADLGVTSSTSSLAPPSADRARSTSAERDERRQRRRERERQREHAASLTVPHSSHHAESDEDLPNTSLPVSSPRHPDAVERRRDGQRMSHQASLRSLVSASESSSGTGEAFDEARIMQEILEEGLLGDIDIDALNEEEQDRLAERIADLYRRRHPRQSFHSTPPRDHSHTTSGMGLESHHSNQPANGGSIQRSNSGRRSALEIASMATPDHRTRSNSAQPPSTLSRSDSHGSSVTIHHRRRVSDQTRQVRSSNRSRHASTERTPAARSATNLVESRDIRPLTTPRTNTDPQRSPPQASQAHFQSMTDNRNDQHTNGSPPFLSPRYSHTMPTNTASMDPRTSGLTVAELDSTSVPTSPRLFDEPSLSCFRCQKPDIQYDIYRHCRACKLDLCMRCYRDGRGCKHWYGFGHAADVNFENAKTTDETTELPHVLIGRQYIKPPAGSIISTKSSSRSAQEIAKTTKSSPSDRLQEGHFCDRCGTFANSQFWLCDFCNDGEWGFCKQCVQTHHCCTHPLLPIAYVPPSHLPELASTMQNLHLAPHTHPRSATTSRPTTPNSTISHQSRRNSGYDYLSINVNCNICDSIIFPSSMRHHCPTHPTDYDICTSCYASYLAQLRSRNILHAETTAGWRKCPQGHRMIILAFECDAPSPNPNSNTSNTNSPTYPPFDTAHYSPTNGVRRVVKADLVGGWKMTLTDQNAWNHRHSLYTSPPTSPPPAPPSAMLNNGANTNPTTQSSRGTWSWKEDTSGTKRGSRHRAPTLDGTLNPMGRHQFPPDGGFGMKGAVYYAYWPEEGDDGAGELRLPRGAEVTEIEDVNGDWWSGVYAGDIGVFPYGFVRDTRE